ncbi:MAG: type II/IV secretion system protein [Armatimonadetes bacterium]|nr:type II/IV secretion system protein [Armatimonadota bacterium]
MAGDAARDRAIADGLLRQGVITDDQLAAAEAEQQASNVSLVQALLRTGACTAQDLARVAGAAAGESEDSGFVLQPSASLADVSPDAALAGGGSLDDYQVDPEAIREVPRTLAEEYCFLPLQVSEGRILLAMADPDNVFAIDEVRKRTGRRVEAVQVPEQELIHAIDQYYSTQARAAMSQSVVTRELGGSLSKDESLVDLADDLAATVDEAPVVRVVEKMIRDAAAQRASDIHIEPRADVFVIRFRVDGVLQTITELPIDLHRTVASRLKILGGCDISESRLPQDGRFATLVDDRPIDIRLSTLPTYWGEKLVLRLLDKSAALVSLTQLGMLPDMMKHFDTLLHTKQGMVLVTGPTGSGKSTTLYASLHKIKDDTLNITTVEDPIEYEVEGVNQTQVHARIDLSFARCLRHILRQDPDIILIGEVRDYETAEMAFRAALTGHLVLSTLHTNDAPSAATRLVDMQIEPYMIASCVIGVLAQRLIRRICPRCREQYEPTALEIEELRLKPEQAQRVRFFRGRGCEQCRNTGHYGRVGLYELMTLNNELRDLIVRKANAAELRQCAVRNGMKTLRYDGLSKMNAGLTSAGEVIKVLMGGEDD